MSKQGQDGRWVLEKTPGNIHTGFGTRGRPNKWVTLNAMSVLKRAHEEDPPLRPIYRGPFREDLG